MKKLNLDGILEKVLEKALASLEARATAIVEDTLGKALEAKLKALLGEPPAIPEASTPTLRAKAKAQAQATPLEATPALALDSQAQATPVKARKRAKAQAQATPALAQDDVGAILDGVKLALEKYRGASTPRGKPLNEVLYRRVKKVLEHAQTLGRHDLPPLARSALAVIGTDPMAAAMGSWKALAEKLGLPVHVGSEE